MSSLSYEDLIRAGSKHLSSAGLEEPVREARQLLLLISDLTPALLIAMEQEIVPPDQVEAFKLMINMRAERTPYAHIAGEVEFYGLQLRSDSRALIPRPDSESAVELALESIPDAAALRLADLGTGSGALLAALLTARPQARGIAVEASQDAIMLAAENFESLDIADRVQLFFGSWSDWTGWEVCDLIVSNPPYIRSDVIPNLEPEVRNFDPLSALDGGVDGLTAYREIIALAADQMKPGGHLILEIGFDQKQAVLDLLTQAGFSNLRHKQDLGGHDRAIGATKT